VVRVRRIGYWRSDEEDHWPDPSDLIDEAWDDRERELVALYLEEGFIPWVGCGVSLCRICGRPNGAVEFTDGVYVWPEGLAHYVRDHSVRLPAEVLVHIKGRHHDLASLDVDDDWWPEVAGGKEV
jgi:hypothetical protein